MIFLTAYFLFRLSCMIKTWCKGALYHLTVPPTHPVVVQFWLKVSKCPNNFTQKHQQRTFINFTAFPKAQRFSFLLGNMINFNTQLVFL